MELVLVLIVLGLIGGMIAGLLGLGGAVIMIPLVLYVPPFLGLPGLSMKAVAGIVMVQVMFASLAGAYVHRKHHYVNPTIVLWFGCPIVLGALTGGILSKFVDSYFLTLVFALLAIFAYYIILLPKNEQEVPPDIPVAFNKLLAVLVTLVVGLCIGMVGAGGGFVLIPLMINFFNIPTRLTIGSSLGIVLMSSVAGFIGKLTTGQIPFLPALALVIGAIPGALAGGILSKRTGIKQLKLLLAGTIGLAGGSVWFELMLKMFRMPTWQALLILLSVYLIIAVAAKILHRLPRELCDTKDAPVSSASSGKGAGG
ncbi:MAG: sulfite exporter TauE/SafE family protein [Bacillota bacterium]